MCVCVCVPHDKVLWGYSGKMQECRMAVPEAIPATSFENGGNWMSYNVYALLQKLYNTNM